MTILLNRILISDSRPNILCVHCDLENLFGQCGNRVVAVLFYKLMGDFTRCDCTI